MSKGEIEILIFRAYEGCKYVWYVTIDDKIENGVEETYKEALEAVEVRLDKWLH